MMFIVHVEVWKINHNHASCKIDLFKREKNPICKELQKNTHKLSEIELPI